MILLQSILEKFLGVKNVEEGELITPIDEFVTSEVFKDENLEEKLGKQKFKKGDEFEVLVVTPHEVVAYVKNKDVYVVLQSFDLSEFEDID